MGNRVRALPGLSDWRGRRARVKLAPFNIHRGNAMNKRFWMAFAACYVAGQVLGFVINGVLLEGTYKSLAHVWRPEAEMNAMMWVFMLTSFVAIFLFCLIFTKGYENKGIGEGLRYGALVGALMSVPMAFDSFVIYPITFQLAVTWLVTGLVYWLILGAILASIYKRDTA